MAEPVPLKGNPTLSEVLQWLEDKGVQHLLWKLSSVLLGYNFVLYTKLYPNMFNCMFPNHKKRMDKKVVDLARDIAKVELPPYRHHLDVVVACEDEDDNDVVSIYFR
ncbi:Ubiquitin-activating enzyme E1 1 [Cardamine amara subsp. amara]|uniref:Ubiquitin-activating enzyme E1 1 n=1 Tax=Cardamine amara subsp. amara TaxID=228776 RepID=A0ABD0ZKC3_CARAN